MVSRQKADIADTLHLRNVVMATSFWIYMGTHLCHLVNRTEPSICGGDAALCQITLTTCLGIMSMLVAVICSVVTHSLVRMTS